MSLETAKPEDIEVVPNSHAFFSEARRNLLIKAGLALGVLASAAAAATAHPNKAMGDTRSAEAPLAAHPLDYVGIASNRIWVPDLDKARQAAQDIAATNATTVRIFQPYNLSQMEFSYDLPRLCNAAEAARENNLMLEISFIGVQTVTKDRQKKLRHNYVPSNAGGVSRYLNFVKTIIMDVAGPNTATSGPDGKPCVEEPLEALMIEDLNEVNSRSFNSNTKPAKKYAYLVSRTAPVYDKIEQDINQAFEAKGPDETHRFKLVHAVGALAAGSHDPVGFLRDFDRELKNIGVTQPGFDLLALHPYPTDPSRNPAEVVATLHGPVKQELDSAWGKDNVGIIYDEFGVPAISEANRKQYGNRSLSASTVSESTQAKYYKDTIAEAASQDGVVGILTFQGRDEKDDGWPTGVYRPDGKRKFSWNTLADTFYQAKMGTLSK